MAVSISGNSVLAGKTQVGQAFLLDDYRDAAAAYSLRKLRYAYSGSAVRVRRSSDNTEQDIGFDAFGNLDEGALANFVGQENLLKYSEQFDNAYWGKNQCTISSNFTTAPDGTLTADKILENGSTGQNPYVYYDFVASLPNNTYNFSCYVKAAERNYVFVNLSYASTDNTILVNLNNGTIVNNINNPSYSITDAGNGWYRISITVVKTSNNSAISIGPKLTTAYGTYNTTSNYGIYIWGAQLNTVSLKPYVQTTTAALDGFGYVTKWYDQSTGSQQNLLQYSEQFNNAYWSLGNATISANVTTAPDGTLSADKLVDNNTNGLHLVDTARIATNETLCFSVYAKASDLSIFMLRLSNYVSYEATATFNLSTGVITATSSPNADYTNISSSITDVGNGWYRCTLTATKGSVNNTNRPVISLSSGAYVGFGQGVFIWGAQLNTGSFPRNYTPTTSSTIDALRDASQSTAASQPRIVNAGVVEKVNGKAACYFNGSNSLNSSSSITVQQNISLFSVINAPSDSTNKERGIVAIDNGTTSPTGFWFERSTYNSGCITTFINNAGINSSVASLPNSGFTIKTASVIRIYNTSLKQYLNGVNDGTSTSGGLITTNISDNIIYIGRTYDKYLGNIPEIILYFADKSSVRTGIESNINQYYNIY